MTRKSEYRRNRDRAGLVPGDITAAAVEAVKPPPSRLKMIVAATRWALREMRESARREE